MENEKQTEICSRYVEKDLIIGNENRQRYTQDYVRSQGEVGQANSCSIERNKPAEGAVFTLQNKDITLDRNLSETEETFNRCKVKLKRSKSRRNGKGDVKQTAQNRLFDDDEMDARAAFKTLITTFGGRAKFKDLIEEETLFPASFFNTDWLKRHSSTFTIFERNQSLESISVHFRGAKLCVYFNTPKGCTNEECKYFHVCSGFVTETCKPHLHKCSRSHNFLERKVFTLVKKLGLDEFKNKEIARIVRCSVPEVCREYNQGVPHDEETCPYLHVCDQYPCSQTSSCQLEHSCLSSKHNLWVLNCFRIGHFKESVLENMILGRRKEMVECGAQLYRTAANSTKRSGDDNCDEMNAENAFKTLLRKYEGKERWNRLSKHTNSFPKSFFKISWLQKHKYTFVVFKNSERIEYISVYCRQARVCAYFDSPRGCTNKKCQYFHVCSAFVTGQCPNDDGSCFLSHNFFDQNNAFLLERKNLLDLSHGELVKLVRCSSPEVCQKYNRAESHDAETCTYLHVCDEFPCRKGASCHLEHTCLSSAHNKRILACFHISHYQESNLSRMILGRKCSVDTTQLQTPECTDMTAASSPRTQETSRGAIPKHVINSGPTQARIADDQFLCEQHIWDTCRNPTTCPHYHSYRRLPYQWQIELNHTWHDFTESANDSTEELFCDLKSSADSIIINEFMCADIDLISMTAQVYMISDDNEPSPVPSVRVRRLSTMSYSEGKGNLSHLTCWCWYWRDDDHVWVMYDSPQMQYTLERKYMYGQLKYFFSKGKFHYKLTYRQNQKMSQQNLLTGTKRRVIRRPIHVTRQRIKNKQTLSAPGLLQQPPRVMYSVPGHWVPLDLVQPFELVNLDAESPTYLDVKKSFHFTLPESRYMITSIFRVQNPTLWDRHCSHQRSMEHTAQIEGVTDRVGERMLFHGTDTEQVVRGICVNGFDPRLCGKNATAFGKGAYFAKKAYYSNRFTCRLQRKRFMFRARVLVGRFTKGNAHLTRPPSRQGHLLYDSCVDDVDIPTIFVIFDIDKAYPEFLIEYEKEAATTGKPLNLQLPPDTGTVVHQNLSATPASGKLTQATHIAATKPGASSQVLVTTEANTATPYPHPAPSTVRVYPSTGSSSAVRRTQSFRSDNTAANIKASHTDSAAGSRNVGSVSSLADVGTAQSPVNPLPRPNTTSNPTTNALSRPTTIISMLRSADINSTPRSPTISSVSRSPAINSVSRSPTISSVSKSPTIISSQRSTATSSPQGQYLSQYSANLHNLKSPGDEEEEVFEEEEGDMTNEQKSSCCLM